MKIFISWSGDLSKKVAQELKKWLPCIIQSVEVFYSPEDIEKGENWDSKISAQLSECNYGIVCLTSENTNAPWINFEAGAIAKTLESRVSALMINIKTSEIQGPLKRYQATKLEKDDMYQLIEDINKATDNPLASDILDSTFNAIWDKMYDSIRKCIKDYRPVLVEKNEDKGIRNNEVVEEILQLVRKQNVIISSPEQLLPPEYFAMIHRKYVNNREGDLHLEEITRYVERLLHNMLNLRMQMGEEEFKMLIKALEITEFIDYFIHFGLEKGYGNARMRKSFMILRDRYIEYRKEFEE